MLKPTDFLKQWRPTGFWVLTAIPNEPDPANGVRITTRSFSASEDPAVAEAWIAEHNTEGWNVYFTVNPTRSALSKKAKRSDIARLEWLHVDVDPTARRTADECLAAIQESPLPPTCITFSGGGYQAFWKLREPLELDGGLEAAERAKLWNLRLEEDFEADHCHNIDRVMRLPGTINWPDAKKIARGREKAEATVVAFHPEVEYDLSQFTPASEDRMVTSEEITLNIDWNTLPEYARGGDLPESINPYCRMVIVQGCDPDEPNKWPSRSEPLLYVTCEMLRSGCTDQEIMGILTSKSYGISESVYDHPTGPQAYASKQLRSAKEKVAEELAEAAQFTLEKGWPPTGVDWIDEMNGEYAIVQSYFGKFRIMGMTLDDWGREVETFFGKDDFVNANAHRYCEVKTPDGDTVRKPQAQQWLQTEKARRYRSVVFSPGNETEGVYNLWRGFAYDPDPEGDCSLYLTHIHDNVCQGREDLYEYILNWMAQAVQKPDEPGGVALVAKGGQGTGKGTLAEHFGELFGAHFLATRSVQSVLGRFNEHLKQCCVLFLDEAIADATPAARSKLKGLITESRSLYEPKGLTASMGRSSLHVIMASNNDWVVPADYDDRRFLVIQMGDGQKQVGPYFQAIEAQMKDRGYGKLLHLLQTRDISNFKPGEIPRTKAMEEQKRHSLAPLETWWLERLHEGVILCGPEAVWPSKIPIRILADQYRSWLSAGGSRELVSEQDLMAALRKLVPADYQDGLRKRLRGNWTVTEPGGAQVVLDRAYCFMAPPLDVARAHWDEHFGVNEDWDTSALEPADHEAEVGRPVPVEGF